MTEPARPEWSLELQVRPLQAAPVKYETTPKVLQGSEFLTVADGQYLLQGLGQCINALCKKDEEVAGWTTAALEHIRKLHGETQRVAHLLGDQIQSVHDGAQAMASPLGDLQSWTHRAGPAIDQALADIKKLQTAVDQASGGISRVIDEVVKPELRDIRSQLESILVCIHGNSANPEAPFILGLFDKLSLRVERLEATPRTTDVGEIGTLLERIEKVEKVQSLISDSIDEIDERLDSQQPAQSTNQGIDLQKLSKSV